MTYEEFLLALVIWREARGEGMGGMQAVGCVIRNRVVAWAKSYRDAILGPNQFSSMSIKGDPNTVLYPLAGDPVFALATAIVNGAVADPTGGALYYADEKEITSGWYRSNIIESPLHPITVVLGRHTFRK